MAIAQSLRPTGWSQAGLGRILSRLQFQGRKRVHNADELMSAIVAGQLVAHLERSGFVVMKKPPIGGAAALGRGHEGR